MQSRVNARKRVVSELVDGGSKYTDRERLGASRVLFVWNWSTSPPARLVYWQQPADDRHADSFAEAVNGILLRNGHCVQN